MKPVTALSLWAAVLTVDTMQATAAVCDIVYATQVFASRATAHEDGQEGLFTVYLGNISPGLTIRYTITGSAANGADYTLIDSEVTIPPGQTAAVIPIQPVADAITEPDETVTLTLQPGTCQQPSASYSRAVVTIKDAVVPYSNTARPEVRWTQLQPGFMNGAAISPDGRYIATAGYDGLVRIYDAASGELVNSYTHHASWINHVVFSPDSALIASSSFDQTIIITRISDAEVVRTITGTSFYQPVVFNNSGTTVFVSGGMRTISQYEIATGALIQTYTGHTGPVWSLDLSPDGQRLVSSGGGGDFSVKLWNVATGALVRNLGSHSSHVWTVRFSPLGNLAASGGGDGRVIFWSLVHPFPFRISTQASQVLSLAFTRDGQYVAGGTFAPDNRLYFWRVSDAAVARSFTDDSFVINFLQFSRYGGSFVYAREDGLVVFARNPFAPAFRTSAALSGSELRVNWSGGSPPYQIQTKSAVADAWQNVGGPVEERTTILPISEPAMFVRVSGSDN